MARNRILAEQNVACCYVPPVTVDDVLASYGADVPPRSEPKPVKNEIEKDIEQQVLDETDAAVLLKTTPGTVIEMAKRGALPGKKVGRQWRFSLRVLLEWFGTASQRPNRSKPAAKPKPSPEKIKPVDWSKKREYKSVGTSGNVRSQGGGIALS